MPKKVTVQVIRPRTSISPRVVILTEKMYFGTDNTEDAKNASLRAIEKPLKAKLVALSREMQEAKAIRDDVFDDNFLIKYALELEVDAKPMTMTEFAEKFNQPRLL